MVEPVSWLADLLTGTLAVSIAVLAVAVVGFMFLQGFLPWERFAKVVLGSFLVFGASSIALGLANLSDDENTTAAESVRIAEPPVVEVPAIGEGAYTPYPGAAMPVGPSGQSVVQR